MQNCLYKIDTCQPYIVKTNHTFSLSTTDRECITSQLMGVATDQTCDVTAERCIVVSTRIMLQKVSRELVWNDLLLVSYNTHSKVDIMH